MEYPNRECRFFIPKEDWVYKDDRYKQFLLKIKAITKAATKIKRSVLKNEAKMLVYSAIVIKQEGMKSVKPLPLILNKKQLYYRIGLNLYGKVDLNKEVKISLYYYDKKFSRRQYIYAKNHSIKKYQEANGNLGKEK